MSFMKIITLMVIITYSHADVIDDTLKNNNAEDDVNKNAEISDNDAETLIVDDVNRKVKTREDSNTEMRDDLAEGLLGDSVQREIVNALKQINGVWRFSWDNRQKPINFKFSITKGQATIRGRPITLRPSTSPDLPTSGGWLEFTFKRRVYYINLIDGGAQVLLKTVGNPLPGTAVKLVPVPEEFLQSLPSGSWTIYIPQVGKLSIAFANGLLTVAGKEVSLHVSDEDNYPTESGWMKFTYGGKYMGVVRIVPEFEAVMIAGGKYIPGTVIPPPSQTPKPVIPSTQDDVSENAEMPDNEAETLTVDDVSRNVKTREELQDDLDEEVLDGFYQDPIIGYGHNGEAILPGSGSYCRDLLNDCNEHVRMGRCALGHYYAMGCCACRKLSNPNMAMAHQY